MFDNTERDREIFRLWDEEGLSFEQIAQRDLPSCLTLSSIRGICYRGPEKHTNSHQREIYKLFRIKFLELQNINKAIKWVYENQPPVRRSAPHIRKVINQQMRIARLCSNK